jgi:hypothetical protein
VRNFRSLVACGAAAVAVAVIAGPALAGGGAAKVAFRANFAGKAVVQVSGSHADITSARASGRGTPIGKATLFGKGTANNSEPCPLFGGPGTITTRNGKLKFVVAPTGASACTDEQGQDFSLSGRAKFKGGTGKYARARGSFRFTGSYTRSTGAFSVRFLGTLRL